MDLEAEEEVAGFLGVHISKNTENGKTTLTQPGLIKRIIEALKIEDLPGVDTPANEILGKDEFGDPASCDFNYASVVGMMQYLYGHSRPDIGFALSQAARFSFNPKRSHELALIRIGQYLKKTHDKGLIMEPAKPDHFEMDVYVDSDFMGLYGREDRDDPANVKSRTGYVICLNNVPIVWSSKLQESIALSTMMAEYYALSTSMREVIPLRALVQTVARGVGMKEECLTTSKTTVWEDNNGALTLANLDPGQNTARSKHFDVKVHWFRSKLKPHLITVKKIATEMQRADLFTKAVGKEIFERLRKLLLGWWASLNTEVELMLPTSSVTLSALHLSGSILGLDVLPTFIFCSARGQPISLTSIWPPTWATIFCFIRVSRLVAVTEREPEFAS
jgi:hypothetical protein